MREMEYKIGRNLDVDETADLVEAGKCRLYGWYVYNVASAVSYLKIYDKATAATVGTDVPKLTLPIPAGGGANIEIEGGLPFSLGISVGATTGVADNNQGAPATNDVVVNLFYK